MSENSSKEVLMRPEQRRLFRYLQITGTTPFTISHGLLRYVQYTLKTLEYDFINNVELQI